MILSAIRGADGLDLLAAIWLVWAAYLVVRTVVLVRFAPGGGAR